MNQSAETQTVKGYVSGKVQGVGYRYFVEGHALEAGLTGYAKNLSDGRVEFVLEGQANAIEDLLKKLRNGPACAQVDKLNVTQVDYQGIRGFEVI